MNKKHQLQWFVATGHPLSSKPQGLVMLSSHRWVPTSTKMKGHFRCYENLRYVFAGSDPNTGFEAPIEGWEEYDKTNPRSPYHPEAKKEQRWPHYPAPRKPHTYQREPTQPTQPTQPTNNTITKEKPNWMTSIYPIWHPKNPKNKDK